MNDLKALILSKGTLWRTIFVSLSLLLLGGVLVVGWKIFGSASGSKSISASDAPTDDSEWVPVRRGDFEILCRDEGELRPVKVTTLTFLRQGKLSFIIPEGTSVKKGERVLELETNDLEDQIQSAQKDLTTQAKNLVDQQQNREIETKRMQTDLLSERERVEVAQLKEREVLAKPTDLDKAASSNSVEGARARLVSAQLAYDSFLPLVEMGFGSRAELETKRIALEQAKIEQERAQLKHQQLLDGALPDDKKRAALEREQAELGLKLKELDNEDQVDALNAKVASAQREANAAQRKVDRLQEELKQSTVYAPHDGIVIHRVTGRNNKKAEVGENVGPWTSPLDLPRYDVMKVRTQVPESFVRRLQARSLTGTDGKPPRKGSFARVMVKTLPDKIYTAEVIWIDGWARDRNSKLLDADIKAQGYSGVRVFDIEVELQESDPQRLREGFRSVVEFPVETLKDVFSIPVNAISTRDGKIQVQVRNDQKGREYREVTLGAKSVDRVVVTTGLTENDVVYVPKAVQRKETGKPKKEEQGEAPAVETPKPARSGGKSGNGGGKK